MWFRNRTGRYLLISAAIMCMAIAGSPRKASAQLPAPSIRVKAGIFLPQNSSLKNAAGNTWIKVGADTTLPLGLGILGSTSRVGIEYAVKGSTNVVPITLTQIWQPSTVARSPIYIGGGAGLWTGHVKGGGTNSRLGLRAVVGFEMTDRMFIEGEYDFVGKMSGTSIDGLSVLVGTKF